MPAAADAILLENVWKRYGKTTALAGLSLGVPEGSIFGFLGPNGAGKSTAIRILLGLQRPSRGTVSVLGRQLPEGRVDVLRRIGSMVESPSPYLHLTGRENLEVHTRLLGVTRRVIGRAASSALDLLRCQADVRYWVRSHRERAAGPRDRARRSNSAASAARPRWVWRLVCGRERCA